MLPNRKLAALINSMFVQYCWVLDRRIPSPQKATPTGRTPSEFHNNDAKLYISFTMTFSPFQGTIQHYWSTQSLHIIHTISIGQLTTGPGACGSSTDGDRTTPGGNGQRFNLEPQNSKLPYELLPTAHMANGCNHHSFFCQNLLYSTNGIG